MSSSARPNVLLCADFAQYNAEFGVRSPSRLVARRTHAPAVAVEAQAHIKLSRLSYISHSSLQCTASDSRPVPPTPCSRRSFAAVHQSRTLAAPNHDPADRTTRFSSPPSLLCLFLSAQVSVLATGNTMPYLLSSMSRSLRVNRVGKLGPGRMTEVGFHECERGCPLAILASVGLDFLIARECIRQRVWRTSDSEYAGNSPFPLPSTPLPTVIPHAHHERERANTFVPRRRPLDARLTLVVPG
jgi:hypothetical protein